MTNPLTPEAEAALTKWADKYNLVRYSATYNIYLLVALGELFQRTVEAAAQQIFTRMEKHNLTIATDLRDAIRNLTVEQVLEEK